MQLETASHAHYFQFLRTTLLSEEHRLAKHLTPELQCCMAIHSMAQVLTRTVASNTINHCMNTVSQVNTISCRLVDEVK